MPSERLADGRWLHRIHQSNLNGFLKCPEQGRLLYTRELEQETTDSMIRGTAAHAGIEYLLDQKILGHDLLDGDLDTAQDIVQATLDEAWPWKQVKHSRQTVERIAHQAVHTWYYDVAHTVDPKETEVYFKRQIHEDAERIIEIAGWIDCVDQNGFVWDWKTSGRPYERWEYQRWAVQPTVYLWATDETWFRYCVLLEDGSVQILDVWRDDGHRDWLLAQAMSYVRLLEANVSPWPLNDQGWWCHEKWCPAWTQCKGLYMPDGWTERVPVSA